MNDTSTATAPTAYSTDARTARNKNLEIRDQQKLPPVAVQGNTFPLRGVLWALGGIWNKDQRCYLMPAHTASEAQEIIDSYAAQHKAHPKVSKPKADKPAVTITAAQVKAAAVVDTRPAIKGTATQATLCKRLANLGEISDTLVTDLLQAGLVESAANVVKALAIFNQEHANLLK